MDGKDNRGERQDRQRQADTSTHIPLLVVCCVCVVTRARGKKATLFLMYYGPRAAMKNAPVSAGFEMNGRSRFGVGRPDSEEDEDDDTFLRFYL